MPASPPTFWLRWAVRPMCKKASCCATRLRFQLKDGAKVDEKALKSAGASGVIRSTPTACQVILGTQVRFVYEELQKLL